MALLRLFQNGSEIYKYTHPESYPSRPGRHGTAVLTESKGAVISTFDSDKRRERPPVRKHRSLTRIFTRWACAHVLDSLVFRVTRIV